MFMSMVGDDFQSFIRKCHQTIRFTLRNQIAQGATPSCPGKLRHFPANTPSWAIVEIIVKSHGQ